ncbi:MAG: D-Ala-D-Ala carboxypeptidase family metallohydrolase [Candidatus Aminicenantes bacterium]
MIGNRNVLKGIPVIIVLSLILSSLYLKATHFLPEYSAEKAGFMVKFNEMTASYRVMSVFVLPGEELTLEVPDENNGLYNLETTGSSLSRIEGNKWSWKSPQEKGLYPLKIISQESSEAIHMNVFVMIPYGELQGEHLNGYRIGNYPDVPLKLPPAYKPPRGFIKVTEDNADTFLVPHFQLKQFLCKQESGYPKFVVLKEKLLLKLELILEEVNEKGYQATTFNILSGYRTPYYNRVIGNVRYSRHVYGGAADIFIDENPRDEMMDDLNKDGQINYLDADVLYRIIDNMYGKSWYKTFLGGLGRYKKTSSHGPFVHIDVRGFHARWGT